MTSIHLYCRGLFIINEQGILRQKTVNDMAVGRSVDETIRLLQAYQFTDVHGEASDASLRLLLIHCL